ncbi:hypothetical protein GZ77_06440 [Endozoicomonas montiporae]|uniref:Large polyvalent protein-associated domain-containing protein n=2 Tax=Endozoicomonas montiporae TaxID=1027273 RepID=A0A081NCC2_9GAMM|nr:LPD38 domain-containing protein [Endozoicomonas montiporae]AMO56425.1 hypothetical protein EZMO1_2327 [Endozoicomonas montiporae CL-33]KEQ16095.1 hypothetical protein GZ77_06440 [Endozoicomonas montiporae]
MTVNELSDAIDNELSGRPMFADFQGRSIEDDRYTPKAVTNRITEPAVKAALNGEPLSPVYQREVTRLLNEAENDPVFEAPAFLNEQEAQIEQERQANAVPEEWYEQWEPVNFEEADATIGVDSKDFNDADWKLIAEAQEQILLEEAALHEQQNTIEESNLERTAGQHSTRAETNPDTEAGESLRQSVNELQEEAGTSQTEPEVTPSDFSLQTQTEQSLQQQAEQQQAAEAAERETQKQAQQKAEADKERDDFALTGSDSVVDSNPDQADLLPDTSQDQAGQGREIQRLESELAELKSQQENINKAMLKDAGTMASLSGRKGKEQEKDVVDERYYRTLKQFRKNRNRINEIESKLTALKKTNEPKETEEAKALKERRAIKEANVTSTAYERAKKRLDREVSNFVSGAASNNGYSNYSSTPDSVSNKKQSKNATENTATPSQSEQKIEDFGEKIGGARKDVWAGFRESLSGDVDVKALPLSKTFPEPNYEKLHEAGADSQSLAIIAAVRADIPAKPRKSYKLKSWAANVEAARQIASMLVGGNASSDRVLEVMKQDGNAPEGIINMIPVLAKLEPGQLKAAAGYRIRSGSFSIFNGQQRDPGKPIYYLKDNKTKRSHYDQSSESLAELQEQVLGFIRQQLDSDTGSKGRQTRFDVFRTRGTKSYWVGKKIAAGKFITLKTGFDSVGEANKFLKDNQQWLEQELKRKKDVPAHRRTVNIERQGEDYRDGQNITPESFTEAFGFRGVEFGNWVEQGRRQHDLNRAYDALKDLANLINVPTQALSLNGELALAFGARGKGGKKPAAAHYERDKVAINLTKNNGPGSLAHEWWHSLDNYFSRFRNDPDDYLSEQPKKSVWKGREQQRDDSVRPEVEDAFDAVVKAIEKTGMPTRSSELDGTRSKDYWSTVREMTARAFENYVIEKLEASGFHNDYLANIVPEIEFSGSADSYPYLTAKEKESVVKAFDQLFSSLKTEATDTGVKLYRLGNGKGIKLNNARLVAHRMKKELGVGVKAVATESELPDHLQQDIQRDKVSGRVKGIYDPISGDAFIIADKLNDGRDAVKTLLHELVGHKGVRQALGKQLNLAMVGIYRDMPANVRQSLETEYAGQLEGLSTAKRKLKVAEEYVARIAESNPKAPILKRLYSRFKRLLRNIMPSIQWTDADIVELVQAGKSALRKPAGSQHSPETSTVAYSLDDKKVLKIDPRQLIRKGRLTFLRKKMLELAEKLDGKSVTNQATGQKIWFYKKGFKHSSSGRIDHNNELAIRLMPVMPEIIENAVPFESQPDRKGRHTIETAIKLRTKIQIGEDFYFVDLRVRDHTNDQIKRLYDHRVRKEDPAGIDGDHPHNLMIADVSLHPTTGSNLNIDQRKAKKFNDEDPLYSLEAVDTGSGAGSDSTSGRSNFVVQPETWQEAFIRKIQDKFKPLKRTQDAITLNGADPLSEDVDTYLAEELSHGKIEESLRQFENRHVRPLARAIAQASVGREDLDLYLYAKHAPERNAHIAKINDKMPDGGSGMTNEQAADILSRFEAGGKTAELQTLADRIYRINKQRLSLLQDAGLESQAILNSWSRYQNYVPLKGKGEQVESAQHRQNTGRGFDIRGKESIRAMGRRSMAESPVLHSLAAFEETLVRKEKNDVAKTFLNMVQKYPNKEYWEVFSEDRLDTKRMFDPRSEKVVDRDNPFMKFDRDNYLSVKVDGKEHYIKLADKQLLDAMQNLGPEKMGVITQTLSRANRFLASLNTSLNPEFVISNFSRDIQTAVLNVIAEQDLQDGRIEGEQLAKNVVKDVPGAMRGIWRNLREKDGQSTEYQRWFDDFREDGGKIGFFGLNDFDVQARRIKELITVSEGGRKGQALELWGNLRDVIEDGNAAVENAVRLSAYVNARKAGVSRKKAASLAKNLTVNFNRKGELGVYMNALYMFFNAGVQGTAQFARVMKSRRAQTVAAGLAGASLLLAEWNRMIAGEDEDGENWWDKVPDYVKERNLVLMKWWEDDGSYITVPLPYGYNVFHVAGTLADDLFRDKKSVPEVAAEATKALLGAFNPIGLQDSEDSEKAVIKSISPTVLSPVVQLAVNENFYGAPIYKEGFPGATPRPDSTLAMKSTMPLFRDLSTWLNEATGGTGFRSGWVDISPDSIEHLFEFTTGGVGAFVGRSFNAAFGDKKISEMEDREIPFWRKLNGTVSEYRDIQTFYDRLEEVNQYLDEYKSLAEAEKAGYRAEYGNYLKLSMFARKTRKRLKFLNDRIDLVENSNKPDSEKEDLLERLQKRVNLEVDRFNGEYGVLVK